MMLKASCQLQAASLFADLDSCPLRQDSGGELPPAAATPVESERDLRHHLEALVPQLDEKLDWTKRIEVSELQDLDG